MTSFPWSAFFTLAASSCGSQLSLLLSGTFGLAETAVGVNLVCLPLGTFGLAETAVGVALVLLSTYEKGVSWDESLSLWLLSTPEKPVD